MFVWVSEDGASRNISPFESDRDERGSAPPSLYPITQSRNIGPLMAGHISPWSAYGYGVLCLCLARAATAIHSSEENHLARYPGSSMFVFVVCVRRTLRQGENHQSVSQEEEAKAIVE